MSYFDGKSTGCVFNPRSHVGSVEPPATTLEDESRFGRDGTFLADANPDWVRNEAGLWVMDFGGDDHITFPLTPWGAKPFTIVAWFKTTVGGTETIVGSRDANNGFYSFTTADTIKLYNRETTHEVRSSANYAKDLWHHYGATFNGASSIIVVNGSDDTDSNTIEDAETLDDAALTTTYIGVRGSTAVSYFTGQIAPLFYIFNYALTAEQIRVIFQEERHWFGV